MATKIRLRRMGAKKSPFTDGSFGRWSPPMAGLLSELGYYDPVPVATIKIDEEKALKGWLQEPNRLKPPNHLKRQAFCRSNRAMDKA